MKIPELMQVNEIFRGLWITFRSMFEKPVTIQYPEQTKAPKPRFKGRHVLKRYENGLEKCIGCALCAAACPSDAIFVEPAENTDQKRYSPGERYAATYEINLMRCIYCGFCADACPTEAIVLEHIYELAYLDRNEAFFSKDKLLDPAPGPKLNTPRKVEPGTFTRSIPEMQDPV
jgi:NADH-quinone oxidoreductase subunit I